MDIRRGRTMWQLVTMSSVAMVVALWSVLGCASPKKEIPNGVLNQAELTSFLIEMYVAEAHLDAITMPKDSAIKLLIPHEEKLKAKFAISDSTLQITYQYYLENPQELETVYDALIDSLSLKEQKTVKD